LRDGAEAWSHGLWVLLAELPVEPRARNPPPQPLERHAGHRRRGRRQQYVSHEFLCQCPPSRVRPRDDAPPSPLCRGQWTGHPL